MKFLTKVGGVILSFSLIFVPDIAAAKTKLKQKSNHSIGKKSSIHSKKIAKSVSSFRKVSYSYGPKIFADNVEPNIEIYKYAVGLLGTRYKFGGESINGIDCSSFVQNVFELAGFKMPRTAREQARYGYLVRKEDLKPGDLLFFATYASFPSHVGIYIGEGKMIHASSRGSRVEVTSINQDYYQRRFLFAKRIPANINDLDSIKDIQDYMESNEIENDPIASLLREKNEK